MMEKRGQFKKNSKRLRSLWFLLLGSLIVAVSLPFLGVVSLGAQSVTTLTVMPEETSINQSETVTGSIMLEVEAGENFASGTFLLTYDASVLSLVSDSFVLNQDLFGVVNPNVPGEIRFNAISITGVGGTLELATFEFEAVGVGRSDLIMTSESFTNSVGNSTLTVVARNSAIEVVGASQATSTPQNTPTIVPIVTPVPSFTPTPFVTNTPGVIPVETVSPTIEPSPTIDDPLFSTATPDPFPLKALLPMVYR